MKTLAERLAYAMSQTGLNSQTALAKAAGVEQSAISKILRGSSKTSKQSGKLSAALGISADWLINGNGSMYGSAGTSIQKIDVSKLVKVFDEHGDTGEAISWFKELPDFFRAYVMKRGTGIAQAPAGSIVIVNPEQVPSTNDLVVALIAGKISAFRYHIGGDGSGFLSVDDSRVPLAAVQDTTAVVGPIVQIFIPELNK